MRYDWVGFQIRNGGKEGGRAAFEDVCHQAVEKRYPDCQITKVRPNPGDEGIDFYLNSSDSNSNKQEIHAFQCKFFIEKIAKAQQDQISDSIKQATQSNRFKLLSYTFMFPKEFSHAEENWWNNFKQTKENEHGIEIKVIKGDEILRIGSENNLLSSWFHDNPQETKVGCPTQLGTVLPPSIGNRFVGSNMRIGTVAQHFGQPRNAKDFHPQPLVLAGPPGIGKSRLAIEYAHQHHNSYKTQIKLPADTPTNLHSAITHLGGDPRLAIQFDPLLDKDRLYEIVLAQLSTLASEGMLIILDGVNSQESVIATQKFLSSLGGVHAIVTSQIRKWGNSFRVVEVLPLSLDEGSSLLIDGFTSLNICASDARKLAHALGCVPLAIEIAIAYCGETLCNASDYLKLLEEKPEEPLQFREFDGIVEYPHSLWLALKTAWDRVEQIDPWATTILNVSAFYGQAPIPLAAWDDQYATRHQSQLFADLKNTTEFNSLINEYGRPIPKKAIATLQKYCQVDFLNVDGVWCYSVPSLIRMAIRCQYAKDQLLFSTMIIQPYNYLSSLLLCDEQHPSNWTVWSFYHPHVESVLSDLISNRFVWPTVLLAEKLGSWYSACGYNQRAESILQKVYDMEMEAWGQPSSAWCELAVFGTPHYANVFVMHACSFSRVLLKVSAISKAKTILEACESLLPNIETHLQARWFAQLGDCFLAGDECLKAKDAYSRAIEIEKSRDKASNGIALLVYLRKLSAAQIAAAEYRESENTLREAVQVGSCWRFKKYRSTILGSDLINDRVLNAVNLSTDWRDVSDHDRQVTFTYPRWLGRGYGRFTPELAHVLCIFAELRIAERRLDEARLLLDGSLAICWYSLGPLAGLTAEVWMTRKEISADGEYFANSYPDWVLGVLLSELHFLSREGDSPANLLPKT